MVPPTRNTHVLGPLASAHALRLPSPASLRFVTSITRPPRPPTDCAPHPSAPGNAGTDTGRELFADVGVGVGRSDVAVGVAVELGPMVAVGSATGSGRFVSEGVTAGRGVADVDRGRIGFS